MNGPGSSSGAKRGRPKKKPGYNREEQISNLINRAVELYQEPYDDRDKRSEYAPTIEAVAVAMNTTPVRVRKMLVTANVFSTAISREIQSLHKSGMSLEQIMELTGLGKASVYSYLPYIKGIYNLEDPTLSAEKNRVFRRRIQACDALSANLEESGNITCLIDAIHAFEGYPFSYEDGTIFRYAIEGDEIICGKVHIQFSAVEEAFLLVRAIENAEGCVPCAERLGCCNAKELYSIFLRIGACRCRKS